MKSKNIILILILAVVGFAAWAMFNSGNTEEAGKSDTNSPENTQAVPSEGDSEVMVEEVPNGFEGELKASSDKRRGNLMLLLKDSDRIIYLNTSRDYSSLIGKQVKVDIEGSLDDFRLVDIKAQ